VLVRVLVDAGAILDVFADFLPENGAGCGGTDGKQDAIAAHHFDDFDFANWALLKVGFSHRRL